MLVKRLNQDACLPKRSTYGAAGYDISSSIDVIVPKRGRVVVNTGLIIVLPEGCYGRIAPRSGLALKHGIDVGAGIVDRDYFGEIKVVLFNHSDDDFVIVKGDRIAQLILEQNITPEVEEIFNDFTPTQHERNTEGFGSSGIRPLQVRPPNQALFLERKPMATFRPGHDFDL